MKAIAAMLIVATVAVGAQAKDKVVKLANDKVFYVYQDKGSKLNHYIPSNWMGNYGSMKFDDAYKTDCVDGLTCVKIAYLMNNAQSAGWAGIYWAHVANNWGEKSGGYDLTGYKRLTFYAKADQDNVTINEFKMGGIAGEHGDSDSQSIGPIVLTKDWKKYTIELADKNLSHIIGGFCFATANDVVPENGFNLFLDEIRYER